MPRRDAGYESDLSLQDDAPVLQFVVDISLHKEVTIYMPLRKQKNISYYLHKISRHLNVEFRSLSIEDDQGLLDVNQPFSAESLKCKAFKVKIGRQTIEINASWQERYFRNNQTIAFDYEEWKTVKEYMEDLRKLKNIKEDIAITLDINKIQLKEWWDGFKLRELIKDSHKNDKNSEEGEKKRSKKYDCPSWRTKCDRNTHYKHQY